MKGVGCSHCGKSGYRGRRGIFEFMLMTSKVRELALAGASTEEIRDAAVKDGMSTLFDDGVLKAMKGLTTLEEVFKVSKRVT